METTHPSASRIPISVFILVVSVAATYILFTLQVAPNIRHALTVGDKNIGSWSAFLTIFELSFLCLFIGTNLCSFISIFKPLKDDDGIMYYLLRWLYFGMLGSIFFCLLSAAISSKLFSTSIFNDCQRYVFIFASSLTVAFIVGLVKGLFEEFNKTTHK